MKVTIYHNPRCSKSRQTLAMLEARNIETEVVEYLKDPPTPAELDRILRLLELEPIELVRTGEPAFSELGLGDQKLNRDALIAAICANPILMQRPVVVANGKAAVGRPPERVLEIL